MVRGSPGTVGLVPAWARGHPGARHGAGRGAAASSPQLWPITRPCGAVPAAPNPGGLLGGWGGGFSPWAGARGRAVVWMRLPAPAPSSPRQGPASPRPPHPRGGRRRLRVVQLLWVSVLGKDLPLCRGRGGTPGLGLGKGRPRSRPRHLGRGSFPRDSFPQPPAPTVGARRAQLVFGAVGEGAGSAPRPPPWSLCRVLLLSDPAQPGRASGDGKGPRRHSDSLWVCNYFIPARGAVWGCRARPTGGCERRARACASKTLPASPRAARK